MMKKTWILFTLMLLITSVQVSAKNIKAGSWRFELRTTHATIPFVLNLKYEGKLLKGVLHNGKEKITLEDISYINDEILIPIKAYELNMELTQQDDKTLIGFLVKLNKNPVIKTPLIGKFGYKERYPGAKKKPTVDINGKWTLELIDENEDKSPAVGVFSQKKNKITGSILTPTGDYRYLEGFVSGDHFEMASFDGVYNYVFKGSVKKNKLEGYLLSNYKTKVNGIKDTKAELPDAYKQTTLQELKFIFPSLKGENVTLNHPKFKGKPVIVQFFGSWCPNCLDEMDYLIPWYHENSKRGVEIIALAFERSLSREDATRQLLKVQKKMNVPFTILQAGSTSEDKPMDKISGLKNFISFPTTVFLNKDHEVIKVHAGFSGPSTGEYFEKWKKEFNETVDGMLR